MRNILAIAGKEARIYLTTSTSYVVFACFVLSTAYFFQLFVGQFQMSSLQAMQYGGGAMLEQLNLTDQVMYPLFMNVAVVFLFMLPMLTMRLIAEERRTKTLELLMTSPVRPLEIVLGKYLAALLMVALMLALTLFFPLLLQIFGATTMTDGMHALDWNTIATSYLGMFLLGASFVSIGLLTSSVTDSQIVAVMLAFFVLLMFFVMGSSSATQKGMLGDILTYLSIADHLESFVRGVVKSVDVVYYLSVIFVGLFLTYRVIDAQRWR